MNRTVNLLALTALLWSITQMSSVHASQQCLGAPLVNGVEQLFANLQLREQMYQVDQSVLKAWQAVPHEQRDVAALQQKLGEDPVALYHWVRDNTHWLPYEGALRGARGTLLDRGGSSLDRALLLAELLRAAGENVRLAQAPLSVDQQQQLQQYWLQQSRPKPQLAPEPTQQQFEAWSAELNRPVATLLKKVTDQREQAQGYINTVAKSVNEQVTGLTELTKIKPVTAPKVRRHWWVQWQGSEGWRDLDPAQREQAFGKTWLTLNASEISTIAVEQLDLTDQHRLRIMIVAEQLQAGKLHEHIALDHTFTAMELTQQQLRISVAPVNFPTVDELIDGRISAQQAERQLLLQEQWLPAIRLGKNSIIQKAITADGSIEDPLTGQVSSATAAALSSVIAELSTMDVSQESNLPGELSALYVRYEISAPGREKQLYQRPLMNVLSAAERKQLVNVPEFNTQRYHQRGAQLLSDVVLVAQNSHSNAAENTAQRLHDILVHHTEIQGLVSVLDGGSVDLVESIVSSASMRNSVLDLLTFYRFLVSPYGHHVALTELNLLSYVQQVDYRNSLTSAAGFDIINNSVTALVADDMQRANVQFAQGVVDTFLEAELIAPDPSLVKLNNTASQYALSLARNERWQKINSVTQLTNLVWLDDIALKLEFERQLSAGNIIVAPQYLVDEEQPSWWMYNPARAQLLGYDRHARGGVLVETLLDLMSAFESASGAVEMVHTVIGCTLNYSNYDPVCCISVEAAKSFGGDFVKGSALSLAKARWMQLFPDADKAMMFFFEEAVSSRIEDLVDPIVDGAGNYGMNTQCKV